MPMHNNLKCQRCGNPMHPGACGGGGAGEEEEKKKDKATEADTSRAADYLNTNQANKAAISHSRPSTLARDGYDELTAVFAPEPNASKKLTEEEKKLEATAPKTSGPQMTPEATENKPSRMRSPFNTRLTRY